MMTCRATLGEIEAKTLSIVVKWENHLATSVYILVPCVLRPPCDLCVCVLEMEGRIKEREGGGGGGGGGVEVRRLQEGRKGEGERGASLSVKPPPHLAPPYRKFPSH